GFAVTIVSQNEVLFQKGYGLSDIERKVPYEPQSLQNVASVSKTLIGISLMQLVEQGKIKLDDDINTYLPYKVINPYFPEPNHHPASGNSHEHLERHERLLE